MRRAGLSLFGLAVAMPTIAGAHVAVQTVALLSGAIQPWATVDSAALLGASALWIAQGADSTDIGLYLIVAAALMTGMAIGLVQPHSLSQSFTYPIALAVALAVCAARRPRRAMWLSMLVTITALAGFRAGSDAAGGVPSPLMFAGGAFAGGLVAFLAVGIALEKQSNRMVAVATRVIGSWVAALCAMMFAFSWRV